MEEVTGKLIISFRVNTPNGRSVNRTLFTEYMVSEKTACVMFARFKEDNHYALSPDVLSARWQADPVRLR